MIKMGIFDLFKPNVEKMRGNGDVEGLITVLQYKRDLEVRSSAAEALGEIKAKRAVEPLILALNDEDSKVRKNSVEALGKIGDARVVEPLILALNDEDSKVRKNAVEALGKIEDARVVEPLILALKDGDVNVRKNVVDVLGKIGDARALEPLILALNDEESYVRYSVTEVLGNIRSDKAVEPLIHALKDGNIPVRKNAAKALGKIGDARVVEPLIIALNDGDVNVRKNAAEALEKIRDARAVEPLQAFKDEESHVLYSATEALGDIRSDKAVEHIIHALKVGNITIRKNAAEALGKIKDVRTVEPLILALKDEDSKVRKQAAEALEKIGKPAVEPLIFALKDEDSNTRKNAVEALEKIGKPTVEPLILALKDENSNIRKNAAEVLGKIKDVRTVETLIFALKDKDSYVRERAAEALGVIEEPAVEPLILALKDKDSNIRKNAAEVLGKIGDARAVKPLIFALKDEDSDVRVGAAGALGVIGEPAVEHLILALKDKDSNIRKNVVEALGKIKDVRSVESLILALKDKDSKVRKRAAEALGRISDTMAEEPLTLALKDSDFNVRKNAAKALGSIRDARAVEPPFWAGRGKDIFEVKSGYKSYSELGATAKKLLSIGRDHWENENYAEALLAYSQVLHSEPEAADAILMFAVTYKNLLETLIEEYKKAESSRERALSRLTSGNGTETDARNLATSLIAVERWDMTAEKQKEIGGDQYGTAEGLSKEYTIKVGVFLAESYLSIVKGKERSTGSGLSFRDENRAIHEEELVKMKRAVECLCFAMLPDQWSKQFEILARDFAGERFGDRARQLANNRDMINPMGGLLELAEQMAFMYALKCQTNLALDAKKTTEISMSSQPMDKTAFKAHEERITDIIFLPGGNKLISIADDNSITLWDISINPPERSIDFKYEFSDSPYHINNISLSPDGKMLGINGFDGFEIWDLMNKEKIFNHKRGRLGMWVLTKGVFSPDGKWYARGFHDGEVSLRSAIDWEDRESAKSLSIENNDKQVFNIIFSSDSSRLYAFYEDGSIATWDLTTSKMIKKIKIDNLYGAKEIVGSPPQIVVGYVWLGQFVSFSNNLLKSFGLEPKRDLEDSFKVYDLETGNMLRELNGARGMIKSSNDGKLLVCCTMDGGIQLRDTTNFDKILSFPHVSDVGPAITPAISIEKDKIAYGTVDGFIIICNIKEL
jgi:HEAT repeat protein/WD40 repeat protein